MHHLSDYEAGKAYSQALVIDKNGEVYEASGMPASNMRRFEYINHVKTFVGNGMPLTRTPMRKISQVP